MADEAELDAKWSAWREEGERLAEEAGPEYRPRDDDDDSESQAYANVALWAGIAGAL